MAPGRDETLTSEREALKSGFLRAAGLADAGLAAVAGWTVAGFDLASGLVSALAFGLGVVAVAVACLGAAAFGLAATTGLASGTAISGAVSGLPVGAKLSAEGLFTSVAPGSLRVVCAETAAVVPVAGASFLPLASF